MGGAKTKIPRKGILMLVKITRPRSLRTRAIPTVARPGEPLEELKQRVDQAVQGFRGEAVTPRFLDLENTLKAAADDACRQLLEQEANRLEADDRKAMPNKVRYHKETYRINK